MRRYSLYKWQPTLPLSFYPSPAQTPYISGTIRSAFLMTEPAVASSDATNIACAVRKERGLFVVNGRKWWSSGAMDPRCKVQKIRWLIWARRTFRVLRFVCFRKPKGLHHVSFVARFIYFYFSTLLSFEAVAVSAEGSSYRLLDGK